MAMENRTAVPRLAGPDARKNYRLDVLLVLALTLLLLVLLGVAAGARAV
jgi:hypothetical protein